jgi:hypothetical protein
MTIKVGHALVLNLPFANGSPSFYKRPFLVIDIYDNFIDLLNVSSIKGKEKKLLYPSNKKIINYYPPFDVPSFVKMDELYTIEYFSDLNKSIYKQRPPLDDIEINRVIDSFHIYREYNEIIHVTYLEPFVRKENFIN